MSIKLYEAYLLDGDVQNPWQFINELTQQLTPVHQSLARECIVDLMSLTVFGGDESRQNIDKLMSEIYGNLQRQRRTAPFNSPLVDAKGLLDTINRDAEKGVIGQRTEYDLSLVLTFHQTPILPGKFLIFPFGDRKEYTQVMDSMPQLSDYGYWNNTDQPEDVTDEDWSIRGRAWNDALGDSGVPSHRGLSWTYPRDIYLLSHHGDDDPFSPSELLELAENRLSTFPAELSPEELRSRAEFIHQLLKEGDIPDIEEGLKKTQFLNHTRAYNVASFLRSKIQ